MENQEMLFMRNGNDEDNGSDQDDVWDDSALIKAYDVAVKAVKDKIAQRLEYNDADGRDKASRKFPKKNGGLKNKKLETAPPHVMPTTLPPPPPLSVTSSLPLGDSEALSAMLMSWYMSGFHTGYYQGLQQAKYMNGVAKQAP
ncbi:uncharacterized protein GBIM_03586 [Gryllus bimaculatus]|nr:uncharacterized protein GBIM_03586 [Gryllus bimaculatus]